MFRNSFFRIFKKVIIGFTAQFILLGREIKKQIREKKQSNYPKKFNQSRQFY